MTALPDTTVEWVRLVNALGGIAALTALTYRLIGEWRETPVLAAWLGWCLAAAVFTLSVGTARAAQLDAPLNEAVYLSMVVNAGALLTAWRWIRLRTVIQKVVEH